MRRQIASVRASNDRWKAVAADDGWAALDGGWTVVLWDDVTLSPSNLTKQSPWQAEREIASLRSQ